MLGEEALLLKTTNRARIALEVWRYCLKHHLTRLPRSGLLRHPGWGGYRLVGSCSISAGISAELRLFFERDHFILDSIILPHTN